MRRVAAASLAVVLAVAAACADPPRPDPGTRAPIPAPESTPSAPVPHTPSAARSAGPRLGQSAGPGSRFDTARVMRTVRVLAGRIGPRLATAPAYRAAAQYVEGRLRAHGYDVRRQPFPVPAGDSWGVPVEAGRSFNVVATPPRFDPGQPHLLVGAHLDTVAVAPGAEDNASGVAVLLEIARTVGKTRLPAVLVAFGAEEPRGPGELHHFGSQHYVARMSGAQRRGLRAMVALDRVGVGDFVPLSSVDAVATRVREELAAAARRLEVPTVVQTDAASDHEPFAAVGLSAARVGSVPYAGYHSARDVPSVVRAEQLARVGRLLTAWLRGR